MNVLIIIGDEIYAKRLLAKQVQANANDVTLTIIETANEKGGRELFQKDFFEIVIMDIKIPFLHGLSVLKLIIAFCPSTKIIMVSGYAYFHYSQETMNCRAEGHLLKPIRDETFHC